MALTKRQKEVLDFMAEFIAENHYGPNFQEIARGMGTASSATIHKHLAALERQGYLKKSFNRSRALETYERRESVSFAPFLDVEGVYALEVRGESMIDEHILEGDCVLVEKTEQARNGEIVVALIDGSETTLKRFYREGGQVRLQPANSAMEPIVVPAERVRIQGRVLAVHRRYN